MKKKKPLKFISNSVVIFAILQAAFAHADTSTTSDTTVAPAISSDGYETEASNLKATVEKTYNLATTAQNTGATVIVMDALTKIKSYASYYANLHGTCTNSQATAKTICREETSPNLQSTLNQVNTLMSLVTASGVTDACSIMGKALALAQAGLAAYTAACSAARATCESACSTVFTNISHIKELASTVYCSNPCKVTVTENDPQYAAQKAACMNLSSVIVSAGESEWQKNVMDVAALETNENDASPAKSIAAKNKACTYTYASMIISAGSGILSIIKSAQAANKCEDDTSGTSTTSTTTDLCSISTYTATTECICQANPRLAGCENTLDKAGSTTVSALSAQSSPNASSTTSTSLSGLDLSSLTGDATTGTAASSDSSSGVGAPTGGNGALSTTGGNSTTGTDASAVQKALNTNVISTGSGGGGASGGSGNTDNTKYSAYLPGGAKDPTKAAGDATAWSKEVTSQAGKSNWEKIRDRYRDNTSTLLSN